MKYKLVKDRVLREKFKKAEILRLLYKFMYINLLNNNEIPEMVKRNIGRDLSRKLKKSVSKTRSARRCIFTSRGRVNYSRYFGVSRMKMREIIQSGILPGFKKALW